MAINLTSPVTGGAQTGFTSPTYTLVVDYAPEPNGKQWAVSALGGTQPDVSPSSVSMPFTITFSKPKVFKTLGLPNPVTGMVSNVPKNVWNFNVRKGGVLTGGLTAQQGVVLIRGSLEVPAGLETADGNSVRAAVSLLVGAFSQQSAAIGDALVSGLF